MKKQVLFQFWSLTIIGWTLMFIIIGILVMVTNIKQVPDQIQQCTQSYPIPQLPVVVTCYNPTKAQCNSQYWITASGSQIDTLNPLKHRWVAISRDLEKKGVSLHDTIIIGNIGQYSGEWIVKDRMNKRWTNRVDLLVGKKDVISKWSTATIIVK
jgi:3D (Asp-Asp-Asp) domain-containing protein